MIKRKVIDKLYDVLFGCWLGIIPAASELLTSGGVNSVSSFVGGSLNCFGFENVYHL